MLCKKRKIDSECRKYNESWLSNYFVKHHGNKVLSMIYSGVNAVTKEYNIKRHYQTKHFPDFDKFNGHEHLVKEKELCNKIANQQQFIIQGGNLKKEKTVMEAS